MERARAVMDSPAKLAAAAALEPRLYAAPSCACFKDDVAALGALPTAELAEIASSSKDPRQKKAVYTQGKLELCAAYSARWLCSASAAGCALGAGSSRGVGERRAVGRGHGLLHCSLVHACSAAIWVPVRELTCALSHMGRAVDIRCCQCNACFKSMKCTSSDDRQACR
jgi:hypothetical protein